MLSKIVDRHIALHHATGYLFRNQSILLRGYARFAEAKDDDVVRATTALEWTAKGASAGTRHGRLEVIRRFARLMHAEDSRHEVPPAGVFGKRTPRRTPYIYRLKEIHALLKAASALGPRGAPPFGPFGPAPRDRGDRGTRTMTTKQGGAPCVAPILSRR